jgi:hypothetical protein
MGSTINSLDDRSKAQGAKKSSASWLGKNTWKRVLDLVLYMVACVTAGTGLLLAYRLPHGAGNASRVFFLAMVGMSGAIFIPGSPILVSFSWWSILR